MTDPYQQYTQSPYDQQNPYGYSGAGEYYTYNGIQNPCNDPCQYPCPHQSTPQSSNFLQVPQQYPQYQYSHQVAANQSQQSNQPPLQYQYQTVANPNQFNPLYPNPNGMDPPPYTRYPIETPSTSSPMISSPANSKPLAFCKKIHQLNGCGHKEYGVVYQYCGGGTGPTKHPNTQEWNKRCWDYRWQPSNSKKVRMGTNFCNSGCQASIGGWTCCQCRTFVYGKMDNVGVKHKAADGANHYFCSHCTLHSDTDPLTQTVDTGQSNIASFPTAHLGS